MTKSLASIVLLTILAVGSACQAGKTSSPTPTTSERPLVPQQQGTPPTTVKSVAADCLAENDRQTAASNALAAELAAAKTTQDYRTHIRTARTYIANVRRFVVQCRSIANALVDAMAISADQMEVSINRMESLLP